MKGKDVIAAASHEGVNVAIEHGGLVIAELYSRADSGRTEIDVILGVEGDEVTYFRASTELGAMFIEVTMPRFCH